MHKVETIKQLGPWSGLGIYVHAEDGDHETVRVVKQSGYSWLSGGYAFQVVVKPEILVILS